MWPLSIPPCPPPCPGLVALAYGLVTAFPFSTRPACVRVCDSSCGYYCNSGAALNTLISLLDFLMTHDILPRFCTCDPGIRNYCFQTMPFPNSRCNCRASNIGIQGNCLGPCLWHCPPHVCGHCDVTHLRRCGRTMRMAFPCPTGAICSDRNLAKRPAARGVSP